MRLLADAILDVGTACDAAVLALGGRERGGSTPDQVTPVSPTSFLPCLPDRATPPLA